MAISAAWSASIHEFVDNEALTAELLNDEIMSRLLWIYDKMIPVGTVINFASATLPASAPFLWCNGAAVSRTTYANLFAVIGTVFGAGDGSTTFNIPNSSGRVLINRSGSYSVGGYGGESTHVLTTAEMPAHQHALSRGSGSGALNAPTYAGATFGSLISDTGFSANSTGSSNAHNNMQPYLVVTQAIRY